MTVEDHPVRHIDDTVHQRARLGIMAIVCEADEADFQTIRSTLELTAGNLSQHLRVLEEAKLVSVRKAIQGRRPRTSVRATPKGRKAYTSEIRALKALIARHPDA